MIRNRTMDMSLYNRYIVALEAEKRNLSITWFITWLCNYQCPFCWERIDEEIYRKSLMRTNKIKPEKWASAFNELNPGELYLTGGEPTLYRFLPEVIDQLNPQIQLKMTTNFGSSFDLVKYSPFVLDKRFSVMGFSFHPSECKSTDFQKKMDKALELGYNEATDMGIEMVLYPDDLYAVPDMLKYCEDRGVKLILDDYDDPKGKYVMPADLRDLTSDYHHRADENNLVLERNKTYEVITTKKTILSNEVRLIPEVILYGAGRAGKRLVEKMEETDRNSICCFVDREKGGKGLSICGKAVKTFDEAYHDHPDAVFVITIQNRTAIMEAGVLFENKGISYDRVKFYVENKEASDNQFSRGKQSVWCPAGMLTMHIDPNGQAYPCMRAMTNIKQNDSASNAFRVQFGNILDGEEIVIDSPYRCFDSWRCSACDYQLMEDAMRNCV